MSKTLVVMLAACALASASAFAAPRVISDAAMDGVAAGAQSTDAAYTVFSSLFAIAGDDSAGAASVAPAQFTDQSDVTASGEESIAASATNNSTVAVAGAVADNGGVAINGERNLAVMLGGNLALGFSAAGTNNTVANLEDSENAVYASGNADVTATNIERNRVDDGSALVAGINNTTSISTDNSDVTGVVLDTSVGVVARKVAVCDSFNFDDVETDVHVKIDDSFKTVSNKMDISGMCDLSAIVNANTLDDAAVGANLNVTTATATVQTKQVGADDSQLSIPVVAGNSISLVTQNQVVGNNLLVGLGAAINIQ